jgi:lysine/ornithine N-monooxygenase
MSRGADRVTANEQKQQLSVAYVHAVAASAGYAFQVRTVDEDSVDALIAATGYVHHQAVLRSLRIEVQLKATSTLQVGAKGIVSFRIPRG